MLRGGRLFRFMATLQFAVNTLGAIRRETVNGREFIVAPGVALVEGVLNNEFVPADEFGRYIQAWDGRPVPIGHPKRGGQLVSANRLDVHNVGSIFNTHLDGDKLKTEFWFDAEKLDGAGRDGQELKQRLESNEPIEISTAYFRDLEPKAGTFNGRHYEGVARNLRPDHIAVLLDTEGACSIRDGCGVPRINEECEQCARLKANVRGTARRPTFDGTTTASWADVSKTFTAYRDAYYRRTGADRPDDPPESVADAPAAMRQWIAAHTLLGEADADNPRDLLFFPVVGPNGQLYRGALTAVLGGRGSQADIPASALESAQNMARTLIEQEYGSSENEVVSNSLLQRIAATLEKLWHKESGMDELIEQLAANEDVPFTQEELEAMPEDRVKWLSEQLESEPDPTANEEEETDLETEPDPTPDDGGDVPEWAQGIVTKLDDLTDQVADLQANAEAAANAQKNEIVGRLVANETCTLNKAELQAMGLDTLKRLESSFKPANYGGRGGFHSNTGEGELIEAPMPALNGGGD